MSKLEPRSLTASQKRQRLRSKLAYFLRRLKRAGCHCGSLLPLERCDTCEIVAEAFQWLWNEARGASGGN